MSCVPAPAGRVDPSTFLPDPVSIQLIVAVPAISPLSRSRLMYKHYGPNQPADTGK